jgi:hypothetical protein
MANQSTAQSIAKLAVVDALNDLDTLIATFEKVHYNSYFVHSMDEILYAKEEVVDTWLNDSIPLREFTRVGMQITALMSGGHSSMYWKTDRIVPEIKQQSYIPFTGKLSSDLKTFRVTRSVDSIISIDTEIISVNGIPIIDLYKECMSYVGGIAGFTNAACERLFPLYLFFNDKVHAPFKIQTTSTFYTTLGLDINALADFLNSAQAKENYTFSITENNVGLLTYNSCQGYKAFNAFLKKTFKEINDKGIDKLIVDIRENGGGDSGLNDLLLAYITKSAYQQSSERFWKVSAEAKRAYSSNKVYERGFGKEFMTKYMNTPNGEIIEDKGYELTQPVAPKNYFEGKTCFLIGPSTFSSANFLADAVKTYKLSTLIGEPTGEYTNDFGEQLNFTLPNSSCIVFISSTYDIGANGNKSVLEPVKPDISVEGDALTFALKWIEK